MIRAEAGTAIRTARPDPVAFDAYFPPEIIPTHRQGFYIYAHLADDAEILAHVARDIEQFREALGGSVPAPRRARNVAQLRAGTRVTVVPISEDLEFDPPELTKLWRGDWTRFDFEIFPRKIETETGANVTAAPGETILIRVAVQVAGVEIARINCAAQFAANDRLENSLAAAKELIRESARPYQKIFVSYSRRDIAVARSYRAAQLALGNEVFFDSENIRAGADWQAALAGAIDAADVLQLFWSKHSARSENVRAEWEYALRHRCAADRCVNFIRPVYWQDPPPEIPPPLGHLHFRRVVLETN